MTNEEMRAFIETAMRMTLNPEFPGLTKDLKMELADCSAEEKSIAVRVYMDRWLMNPRNLIHGGMLAFVFDNTMAMALTPYMQDNYFVTLDMTVHYIKEVPMGTHLLVKNRVLHRGRSTSIVRAEAYIEETGVLAGAAEATFMAVPNRSAADHVTIPEGMQLPEGLVQPK